MALRQITEDINLTSLNASRKVTKDSKNENYHPIKVLEVGVDKSHFNTSEGGGLMHNLDIDRILYLTRHQKRCCET